MSDPAAGVLNRLSLRPLGHLTNSQPVPGILTRTNPVCVENSRTFNLTACVSANQHAYNENAGEENSQSKQPFHYFAGFSHLALPRFHLTVEQFRPVFSFIRRSTNHFCPHFYEPDEEA
jgi:hypothetical protein